VALAGPNKDRFWSTEVSEKTSVDHTYVLIRTGSKDLWKIQRLFRQCTLPVVSTPVFGFWFIGTRILDYTLRRHHFHETKRNQETREVCRLLSTVSLSTRDARPSCRGSKVTFSSFVKDDFLEFFSLVRNLQFDDNLIGYGTTTSNDAISDPCLTRLLNRAGRTGPPFVFPELSGWQERHREQQAERKLPEQDQNPRGTGEVPTKGQRC
jgi:hypothetical protein